MDGMKAIREFSVDQCRNGNPSGGNAPGSTPTTDIETVEGLWGIVLNVVLTTEVL